MHPLLEQDALTATGTETPTTPVAGEVTAPVGNPVDPAASETPAEEDPFIKIDSRNIYQELARLDRENESFRNNLRTFTGRTAKRRYEPQLEQLKAENESLKQAQRQASILAMQPQDIEEKFAKDPEFAREYADAIHAQPIDLAARNEQIQWQQAIEDVFDAGLNAGLPPQRIEDYRVALSNGHFDAEGLSVPQQFARMQTTMNNEIAAMQAARATATTAAPVQVEAPTATATATPVAAAHVNPALAEASPDLSNSRVNGDSGVMNWSETRQMSRQEQMARWPNWGDFDRDVASGKIIMDA